jgi:outer membrane lipoprotein-sorting protein
MRTVLLSLVAAFAFTPLLRADDAADARAIVEKAIKARGDKLDTKNTGMTWKDAGKLTVMGVTLAYTADWAFQAPDKYRFVFNTNFNDAKITLIAVVNGENAWAKEGDKTEELTGEKLAQTRNEAYQFWVTLLVPLVTDKGFTLATAPGKDADGKPTVAVKVTRDKKPAMTLYFDKESGLLVKREIIIKDEFQQWKEVLDEAHFSDYKESNGLKHFTKLKIVRDGKTFIETTLSDAKEVEKLDAKLFEKP